MHFPLEFEVVSANDDAYGREKVIYVGSQSDCNAQLKAIRQFDTAYADKCCIRPYSGKTPKERSHENKQRTEKKNPKT